jgi:AcrR family transcriptional regulator
MGKNRYLELTGSLSADKGDATHERILEAALDQFTEFGLRRSTMDDVASRAGLGRATLYRRFGDKDQLIQAVIARESQYYLHLIEQRLEDFTSSVDALVESFVLAVHLAHAHPLLERLLTSEPADILPFLTNRLPRNLVTYARLYLADQIRKAQDAEHLHPRRADYTAELLIRMVQSFVLSPDGGAVDPGDEDSLRDFARSHIAPLLTP